MRQTGGRAGDTYCYEAVSANHLHGIVSDDRGLQDESLKQPGTKPSQSLSLWHDSLALASQLIICGDKSFGDLLGYSGTDLLLSGGLKQCSL